MARKSYHVMARVEGGWKVIRSGATRASKTFGSQTEAVSYAKNISRNNRAELVIHGRDGRLQQKKSYEHGPNPPKDKH